MSATRIGHDAERVAALEAAGLLDGELEARFDNFLALVAQFFGMGQAAIAVADDSELQVKASIGLGGVITMPLNGSFTETALITGDRVVVEDALRDPRFVDHPTVVGAPYLRSFAVAPLNAPGGERIGVFALADPRPRSFTADELAGLGHIVGWIEDELSAERESVRAREVQRALQPTTRIRVPGYDIDGLLIASHDVGGDFYDWRADDAGATVSLGDVMGKGTGAAMLAATLRGALKVCVAADPADVRGHLDTATRVVGGEFAAAAAFSTLFHAHLDAATGTVRYIDAGHGLGAHIDAAGTLTRFTDNDAPFGLTSTPTEHTPTAAAPTGLPATPTDHTPTAAAPTGLTATSTDPAALAATDPRPTGPTPSPTASATERAAAALCPTEEWTLHTLTLAPGETLIVVSDGVLEIGDGTLPTLDADLRTLAAAPALERAVDRLLHTRAPDHTPTRHLTLPDDITLLRIRRHT